MSRRTVCLLSFALFALPALARGGKKVTVCHVVAGNPAVRHTIVVGEVLTFGTPEVDELDPLIFYDKNYRRLGAHASQLQ